MDAPYNIEIKQGVTYKRSCKYTTDGTTPIDLTDYDGRGFIYASAKDTVPLATFAVTVDTPLLGEWSFTLSAAASAGIDLPGAGYEAPSEFYYQIDLFTAGDADVKQMLFGKAKVFPRKAP